ncbi:hypothetical protein TanjilG_18703 [Lupinus angustifolius]|uniref:Uncharacterized protein n=2 Tax=Lupinus angustifolius TaxID=3871 RepID=A0A1J7FVM4_LUPAN|nr:hypothetical protein TanjilG_18703 [Lupinus angustifolius]
MDLGTVECLRGRLLAERHASRVAKEDAESMANKFVELERKLKKEIKLRDKAERKLKFLKKKLESFKLSSPLGQCYSSQKCENSCGSSSCSSASKLSEGNETKAHTTSPSLSENAVHNHNVAEAFVLIKNIYSGSQFNDTCSFENPNQSFEDLKNGENRLSHSSSKSLAKSYHYHETGDYSSNPSPTHASTENICHNPDPRFEDLKNDESTYCIRILSL